MYGPATVCQARQFCLIFATCAQTSRQQSFWLLFAHSVIPGPCSMEKAKCTCWSDDKLQAGGLELERSQAGSSNSLQSRAESRSVLQYLISLQTVLTYLRLNDRGWWHIGSGSASRLGARHTPGLYLNYTAMCSHN